MPTEDKKNARSENLDALSTENDSKYAMSENMVHVQTEEEMVQQVCEVRSGKKSILP